MKLTKFCAWIFLLLFLHLPLAAEPVVLFEYPHPDAAFLISERAEWENTGQTSRLLITQRPLVYILEYTRYQHPGGVTAFHRADLLADSEGTGFYREPEVPVLPLIGIIAAAVVMLFILYKALRRRSFTTFELLLLPVVLRILLVLITLIRWDSVYPAAADEPGYFETISDMLHGQWRRPWHFTVGTGFFYLPFILLLKAGTFYDIVPYFNCFAALVLAPGAMVLAFLILRKLGISGGKASLVMLIWAVYPFTAFHLELWDSTYFQHFFLLTEFFTAFERLIFYAFCINSGFNAMSDIPGLLVLLGSIYCMLAMPGKLRFALLAGALFGFACLIRINYILLAPLAAFILFGKFKTSRQALLTGAAASVGGFLLIFGIQLVCNTLQFGSPLTFGYILHYPDNAAVDRPASGFTWHTFSRLTFLRYLLAANLPVFAAGTAAMWVCKDNFRRGFLILLTVPVIFFFAGYSHTFCDARRFVFPAFAGMLMALAAPEFPDELPRRYRCALIAGIILMVTLTLPCSANLQILPLLRGNILLIRAAAIIIPVFLLALTVQLFRIKAVRPAVFLLLAALFYYLPFFFLAAGMLLLPFSFMKKQAWNFLRKPLRCFLRKNLRQ